MTDTYFHMLTFCSAGVDTLNDNDYDIPPLDDMLDQKGDAETRTLNLAKTNAIQAYSSAGLGTSLQRQIADKQLAQADSHRTFCQT